MAAAPVLTFDLDVPRRPTADDVDATLVNSDQRAAPAAGMPYADQLNQWGKQAKALAGISPVAQFDIAFALGDPYVETALVLRTVFNPNSLTVTDNGAGDTTITWPENTFPVAAAKPTAHMLAFGDWRAPVAELVTNGVRVQTKNGSGVLTDGAVKVLLY